MKKLYPMIEANSYKSCEGKALNTLSGALWGRGGAAVKPAARSHLGQPYLCKARSDAHPARMRPKQLLVVKKEM